MKDTLVITDLTRMQEGRVCVAGYNRKGECIRPILPPPGIKESALFFQGCAVVFPFAVVEFDFTHIDPHPPHTEDQRFDPRSVQFAYKLDEPRKRKILDRTVIKRVADIFETAILSDQGYYVMDGAGRRSLGTIQPRRIKQVMYEPSQEGQWNYRLVFTDGSGCEYRLTITDLAWRYYCDDRRSRGTSAHEIATDLTKELQASVTYLRIGLARGWEKFPDRCYLQITGVYTFPDYLNGRIFANFHQS